MRCTGLICSRGLSGTALVLIVFAVAGTYSNYLRGVHKSVKLNFPSCNCSSVNELLADSTSNWIKALSSNLTWTLKLTIKITKKLLSSKPTAASQWRGTNLTVILSNEALTSVSHIYSSTFSRVKLSSKVLSLIKFSSPVADLTEDFQSAPPTANFASTLFNNFTTGSPPSENSPTTIKDTPSRALLDPSILPDEATASAKSSIEPASALVSSPNSSSQTYKYPVSSVDPSTLPPSVSHILSPASVPSSLPLDQTSNAPTFLASTPISKTSMLPSSLSPPSISPMPITPSGEPPRSLFQHAPKGPNSSPFPYSASTPLNGGSLPPQMAQLSAQILIPTADVHRPQQAPSPLISPISSKTKPPSVLSSFPNYPASTPGLMSSTLPHYASSPNLPPISSTPTAEPPGGLSRHASTGPSTISYPLLTPSEEGKRLSPRLAYPSASILGPSDVHYPPQQIHSPLTTSSSTTTKPPSVSSNFIPALAPALAPRLSTSLSYPTLASPSSSLPVPLITPEVGHIGVSPSKSSPMPPFSQPASALQAPSFFNSPSPSNAKSPDSSLDKSWATSPVISHTGFLPVASPFTFSPNTLPPLPVPSITPEIAHIGAPPSKTNPMPPFSQPASRLKAPSFFNSPSPSNAKSPDLSSDKSWATSPVISHTGLLPVTSPYTFSPNTLPPLHVPSIAPEVTHIGAPPKSSPMSPFSQPASALQAPLFFNSPSPSNANSPNSSLDKSRATPSVISHTGFLPVASPFSFSPNTLPPLPVPSITPEVFHIDAPPSKSSPVPRFSQPASALQAPSFFNSPSPSNAKSPDSSLDKSWATSPVISHTGFLPAASPFTFSPNTLPPFPVPAITPEVAHIGAPPSKRSHMPPFSQPASALQAPSFFNSPSPSNAKDRSWATSPVISHTGFLPVASPFSFSPNTLPPLPVPSITPEVAHADAPPSKSSPVPPFSQPASALQAPSFFNSPSPSNAKSPDSSLDKSWATSPVISHTGFLPAASPFTFSPKTLSPFPVPAITPEVAPIGAPPSKSSHMPPFSQPASALQAPSFFNSPSPSNAKDKSWATSPVISHTGFLPVASPFTFSPNTLPPLPVPPITPQVAHIGTPPSKSSPMPSFSQPASALQAPSFFNSPSPSNAKSPDSSLDKSWATSPVISHTGFLPVASPFTFPPNTLPPTFSPLHRLENTSLHPQPEVPSSASPSSSQAAAPVVAPISESFISPQSSNFVVPFPWTLSPSAGSPSQQAKTDFSSSSPGYRNVQFSPQQAPLSGFLSSQPSPPHFQASAPAQRSSSNRPMIRSPDSHLTRSPAPTPPLSIPFSYFPSVGPATDSSSSSIPSADISVSSPKTSSNKQGSGSLPFQTPSTVPSFFHSMPPSLGHPIKSTSPTPLQNPPSLPSLSNHQTISSASPSTVSPTSYPVPSQNLPSLPSPSNHQTIPSTSPSTVSPTSYPVPLQNLPSLPSPSNHQTIPSASPSTVSPVLGRTSYPVQSSYSPLPISHTPTAPVTKDSYTPSLQPPLYVAGPNILHPQPPSLVSKPVTALAPHQAPSVSSPPRQFSPTSTMSMSPALSVTEKHSPAPSKLSFRVPVNSPHPHTISKPLMASPHSNPQYPVSPPLLGRQTPLPPSPQNSPVAAPGPQMFGDNSGSSSQHSRKRDAHPPYAPLPEHDSEAPQTSTPHVLTSPTTDLRPRPPQQSSAPLQPAPIKENATVSSPSKHDKALVVPAMPPMIYFPPPPNSDCHQTCADPYTSTPPGSGCGCVLPMVLGIELGTTLYSLFPLVSELAQEIAKGTFLSQSQVRIMGANTVSDNLDKTEVKAYMVPLGLSFDHTVAVLIAQRFWSHQVFINKTFFGNYSVLYIEYPGLPPSPPSQNPVGGPNFGKMKGGNEDSYAKPLSVDFVTSDSRLSGRIKAIIVICCIIAAVTIVGVTWMFSLRFSHYRKHPALTRPTIGSSMTKRSVLSSSLGSSEIMSLASSLTASTASSKTFTLAELGKATKNFRHENVIGEGGFGRVYQGILEDDTKVAVKVLTRDDEQGVREFSAEVEMLSRLHHRNLVKLQGTCIEENVRCLVYELIPNGSVESHLHGDHKKSAPLSWEVRLKIALGSARGLAYLHEDSNPRVIHRDFKSSNILLEDDFNPKVSDFGLAKAASEEVGGHVSTRVMGTFGYVAPEYAMTGHLLVKSDVYSYGVVLLELLSGRKPVNISGLPGEENLVTWARPLLRSKEGLKILVDPNLGADVQFDNFVKVAAIASMCVHPEVVHRPFMGEVVQALKLVYNDSEASGAPSRNNSLSAEFPLRKSDSKTSLVDSLGSSSIFLPDDSSFITVDYDSGPLDYDSDPLAAPNEEFRRPLSDSAILSNTGRFIKQISRSFRNSSGPLKTVRSNPEWYRFRNSQRGTMSEHDLGIQGVVKYHTDIWP